MSCTDKALSSWGAELPDWVQALAGAADATSQRAAAKAMGYSGSAVSQILSNTYKGDMAAVEQAVRASIMQEAVECPGFGQMPLADCLMWQARAAGEFSALSSMHRTMRDACRACPRNASRATPTERAD